MAGTSDRRGTNGGGRSGFRDNRRDDRKAEAQRHTVEMANRLGAEIDRAAKATRFYDRAPKAKDGAELTVPAVEVIDQDSVSAVLERGRGLASACDLAVLDFA